MEEDQNNITEESILYELLEYLIRKQEPELIKCKNDTVILPTTGTIKNALRYLNKRCSLPESLAQYISLTLPWKFAVGDNGKILAILQENIIEIRRLKDEYSSVVAKTSVPKDAFPQWRKLAWSPDGTILALSLSNGNILLYNSLGNNICTINSSTTSGDANILEADDAVVSMIFKQPNKKDNKWEYEFIYVTYGGVLNSCFISTNGYENNHSFSFINFYKNGINGVVYCGKRNLFFVAGNIIYQSYNTSSSQAGLSVWRPLNDYPYYKVCTTSDEETSNKLSFSIWNLYFPFMKSKAQTIIFKMSLNPNSELLACLHMDGTVSLWNVPTLKLQNQWKLMDQPGYNIVNPINSSKARKYPHGISEFHPLDIEWWSNQALAIARYSGAISICSIKNLHNLLGSSPEFLFGPLQMIESSAIRGVLCLDCEINVMSTKRNSVDDDESASESDKETADSEPTTIFNYLTTLIQSILYSMTDIEKFQPKRRKSKIFHRTYRILGLKSTTPEELYSRKIEIEEYEEALNLANTYHLDKDLVYQTQWRKSAFSLSAIEEHLSKVTKRNWVLNECVSRVPDSLLTARELLNFGLRQSSLQIMISHGDQNDDDLISLENDDRDKDDEVNVTLRQAQQINQVIQKIDVRRLNDAQKEIIRYRKKLLRHMDMLKTYEILLDGSSNYDKTFYQEFRQKSPIENAVRFAKDGNCRGVIVMFRYFENVLIPHWLPIISFFPETLDPENYKKLLPKCDDDNQLYLLDQEELRQKDWSERPEFQTIQIDDYDNEEMSAFIYEDDPWFSIYRNITLTQEILCDWYKKRCYEIERLSGLVDSALSLIYIGKSHNIIGLEKLLIELETLDDLVYKVRLENQTLDELDKLTDLDKVKLLMSRVNEANFITHVNNTLIPFAKKKQIYMDPKTVNKLIHDYFVSISKNNSFYILELTRFIINTRNPEIYDIVDDYVQLVLDCLYDCDNCNMLSQAKSIYEIIMEDYNNDERRTSVLPETLEILGKELNCLEILSKYDIKVALNFLRDNKQNRDHVVSLCIKVCDTIKKLIPPANEKTWSQLLSDLLDMQQLVFDCLDVDSCLEIYVDARLKSGVKSTIQNSKPLMLTTKNDDVSAIFKVPFETSVNLVLSASHEYFNNAKSLVDPNMDLAKTCLYLIETDHKKIKLEFDLINSLQLLYDFHLNILPLQVKLMQDKLKLIEDCLNSRSDSYKYQHKLLNVAKYLHVDNNPRNREGKVLDLVARRAFKAEDYYYCSTVIKRLIELSHQPAWKIALDLGHCDKYNDLALRRDCLWFVVNIGPDEILEETIKYINILEIGILDNDLQGWIDMKQANFECEDEFTDAQSTPNVENKEFLPKIIESSSKLVKDSTIMVTKSMFDIVKNHDFWGGNLKHLLKRNESLVQDDDSDIDRSNNDSVQSFSCFYESLHKNKRISNLDTKYNRFSVKDNRDDELKLCQTLLRVQMLKESSCSGEEINDINQLLIECAKHTMTEDCLLSIGYLLNIKNEYITNLIQMFENLPQTDFIIQLTAYYCALKLYKQFNPEFDDVLLCNPMDLISCVAKMIESMDSKNELVLLMKNRLAVLEKLEKEEMEQEKVTKSTDIVKEEINVIKKDEKLVEDENDGWNDQWSDAEWDDFDAEEPKEVKEVDASDEILIICEPEKESIIEDSTSLDLSEEKRYSLFQEQYLQIKEKSDYNKLKTVFQSWPLFFDEQYLTADTHPALKMIIKVKEIMNKTGNSCEDDVLEEFQDLLKDQIIPKEALIEFLAQKEADFSTDEILFLKLKSDESFHSEVVEVIKERKEDGKLSSVILEELFFQNLTSHFSPNHHMYHKILETVFLNRTIAEIQENIEILIRKLMQQKNIPHAVALLSQLESVPPCLSTYDSCFERLLHYKMNEN